MSDYSYPHSRVPWGILQLIFHYVDIKYPLLFVCKRWNKYVRPLIYCDTYKTHVICRWIIKRNINCYVNYLLTHSNIDVVYIAISYGANWWNWCLRSSIMDVVQLGIKNGADIWDMCLSSSNMDVVQLGIKNGAARWYW